MGLLDWLFGQSAAAPRRPKRPDNSNEAVGFYDSTSSSNSDGPVGHHDHQAHDQSLGFDDGYAGDESGGAGASGDFGGDAGGDAGGGSDGGGGDGGGGGD